MLDALKALLGTVPGVTVERHSALPEKIPDGGLVILRDGAPGEPEQALGGFGSTYYQHAVEIEVYVDEGDAATRDAAFDDLLQQIGARSKPTQPRPARPRSTMARAYGSSAHLLMKRETVYGQAATGNHLRPPFNRRNLGSEAWLILDGPLDLSVEGERDGCYQTQLIRVRAARHVTS